MIPHPVYVKPEWLRYWVAPTSEQQRRGRRPGVWWRHRRGNSTLLIPTGPAVRSVYDR